MSSHEQLDKSLSPTAAPSRAPSFTASSAETAAMILPSKIFRSCSDALFVRGDTPFK
jgi:hypothetical protein